AHPARPRRKHDALRPSSRRGAVGPAGRRQGRHRQARRTTREAARGQGRVLGRAGRHPVAGRGPLGLVCRRQVRRRAAPPDAEDKTEKHPVTPGVPTPTRELYGTMLLERGMAKEALAAFEATLKKEPNRLGATLGAGAAAEKLGDSAKVRTHYAA